MKGKSFIERRKSFGTHLFASPVLLNKFGLLVSFGLITLFDWKTHHRERNDHLVSKTISQLPRYILDFVLAKTFVLAKILNQKHLMWNNFVLICCLSIIFTLKTQVFCRLNKICWEILAQTCNNAIWENS